MGYPAGIAHLRIADDTRIRTPARRKPPRPRQGEKFLKGPIPWPWLQRAMSLPGKALHVGIRLWFEMGLARVGEVPVSLTGMQALGVSRFAAARGLRALEAAGLVSVNRHSGRKPVVTVLATPLMAKPVLRVATDAGAGQDERGPR